MKLEIEQPSHLVDISRLPLQDIEELPGRRAADRRAGAQLRRRRRSTACARAIRCCRRRCSPARRRSCATRRRSAATCCSARAARTSTTRPRPCNKREPGSGCAAIGGFNRVHAILGASDACIATHPSDMAVAMTALDAQIELLGAGGVARRVAIARLPPPARRHAAHRDGAAAGRADHRRDPAAAAAGPPALPQGARPRVVRVRAGLGGGRRRDRARARSTAARVAFGGVAHKPWRSLEAEAALAGRPATMATFRARRRCGAARARSAGATTTSRSNSRSARSAARSPRPRRWAEEHDDDRTAYRPRRRPAQGHRPGDLRLRAVGAPASRCTGSSSARRSATAASRGSTRPGRERSPGVRLVMTHRNAPAQGAPDASVPSQYCARSAGADRPRDPPLRRAGGAGRRRDVRTGARGGRIWSTSSTPSSPGHYDFAASQEQAYAPQRGECRICRPTPRSAISTPAFDSAAVKIDQRYTTPYQFSPADGAARLPGGAARRRPDPSTSAPRSSTAARTSIASTLQIDPAADSHRRAVRRRRVRLQAAASTPRRSWRRSPPASWTSRSRSR